MEFTVEFYVSRSGQVLVQEFLEELNQSDPDDHAIVVRGLAKLLPLRAALEINRWWSVRVAPRREAKHGCPVVFHEGSPDRCRARHP